ncbi:MAG: anti-sigma F factor [Clostridiales bacterium]|nr:MAG: anti-sigma F factor [Clostridiales bacterium]
MEKKRKRLNYFTCNIPAKSVNEGFARGIISAFCAQLDPTVEELCDMKTAISEAVTNCIVHAYAGENDEKKKKILLKAEYFDDGLLSVSIKDYGCGIEDIEKAMQPMYSGSGSEERSGMGFSIMQCFTDKIKVSSKKGRGTCVTLKKYIGKNE